MLPAALVVDANVLLSAVIGGRALDIFCHQGAPNCWAAPEVIAEVAEYLPVLAKRKGLQVERMEHQLTLLPVTVAEQEIYAPFEKAARGLMSARDPDDWPTVALALALDLPIWSQDKDLGVSGITVYTTGQLLDVLRVQAGGDESTEKI